MTKVSQSKIAILILFLLAIVTPTNGFGIFTGLPLTGKIESLAVAFIVPLIFILNGEFFSSRILKLLISVAVVLKMILFIFATPSGVCMEPYWDDEVTGETKKVSTYEGFWNSGCFVVKNEILRGSNFPIEHYNRYYIKPEPQINVKFHYIKPSNAKHIVIDTGGFQLIADINDQKGVSSINTGNDGETQFTLNQNHSSAGFISGKVLYKFGNLEWRFRPYFTDLAGKEC